MRKFTGKPPVDASQSLTAKLMKQVDTQAETIKRLNHAVSRLTREKDYWQDAYNRVVNKNNGNTHRHVEGKQ